MKAPRGYTNDICPGCGQAPTTPRPKNGVCQSCRAILNAHKRAAATAQSDGDAAPLRYGLPTAYHHLPYISHDRAQSFGEPDPIKHAFWRLALAASTQATGTEPKAETTLLFDAEHQPPSMSRFFAYRPEEFRMVRPAIASALRTLYIEVQDGMARAYNEGKATGTNLLAMLNAGELTTDDFERRAGTRK